jgi:hypothetical protein
MVEKKKYKLIKSDKTVFGKPLFQVQALVSFGDVKKGDKGGFIEGEENLSHEGDAWVFGDAWVSGNAWVYGSARVFGDAWVSGDARVYGNAWVSGDAKVYGDAMVFGNARVSGRFDLSVSCSFELPRITVNSVEKLKKLKKFLDEFQ